MRAMINEQLEEHQAEIIQEGNTLIVFNNSDGDADLEYHCFNADAPMNLAANVMKFFELAKKLGYKTATTPYENPKISELFKQVIAKQYKVDIKRKDGRYEAKVRL